MAAVTITIEGVKVKSASQRRFIVVKIVKERSSMKVVAASVEKRSDSLAIARKAAEASFRSADQIVVRRVFDSVEASFI